MIWNFVSCFIVFYLNDCDASSRIYLNYYIYLIVIMDETENYLNSILQKRMGSVINTSSYNKNGYTVVRVPQQ
jgi:hypothetical protein